MEAIANKLEYLDYIEKMLNRRLSFEETKRRFGGPRKYPCIVYHSIIGYTEGVVSTPIHDFAFTYEEDVLKLFDLLQSKKKKSNELISTENRTETRRLDIQ